MNRSREPAFRRAQALITRGSKVAIIGCLSRTWRSDSCVFYELFDWIKELEALAWVLADKPLSLCAQAALQVAAVKSMVTIFENDDVPSDMILNQRHVELVVVLSSRVSTNLDDVSPRLALAR